MSRFGYIKDAEMRKLFILTLFFSIQSIWADDIIDELDAAWGKLKKTVSSYYNCQIKKTISSF